MSFVERKQRAAAWLVHAFTASGAFMGLLALLSIYHQKWIMAFWFMGGAICIDAIDGWFARIIKIKTVLPQIDGALLDNIIDFFNYTMVPAFFLLVVPLTPDHLRFLIVLFMTFSSAYQFTQSNAKTSDHFFKGFPSYWNIVVFYLFFLQMNPWMNFSILFLLCILSFVPIKYVYPSRLDYLTHSKILRLSMLGATLLWGAATIGLLCLYPASNCILVSISIGYLILYTVVSLYRTWVPLCQKK